MATTAETGSTKGILSPWEATRIAIMYPPDKEIASPWETSRRRALTGLLTADDVIAIRKAIRGLSLPSFAPEEKTEEQK